MMGQRDLAGAGGIAAVISYDYRDLALYSARALDHARPKLARLDITIDATTNQITTNDATELQHSRSTFEKQPPRPYRKAESGQWRHGGLRVIA